MFSLNVKFVAGLPTSIFVELIVFVTIFDDTPSTELPTNTFMKNKRISQPPSDGTHSQRVAYLHPHWAYTRIG